MLSFQAAPLPSTENTAAAKRVIRAWREGGSLASLDTHTKLHDTVWIHSKLDTMSKGDLALMFEYGPREVRTVVCKQIVNAANE